MKESELRAIIREHIKRTLKEAGPSLGAGSAELERGLGKISTRSSQLTKRQRVQAVIPVLQKFGITSADLPMIKAVLSKMSEPTPKPKPEPEVEENYTAGVDENEYNVIDKATGEIVTDQPLKKDLAKKFAAKKKGWVIKAVNEASRFKGREIYPDWVTPDQMKGMIRNVRDLTKGALYAILEPGMNVWQAEYEYAGKAGPMHLFKSTAQGTGDESDMEFTDAELNDLVKSAEISLMESLNEARLKKVTKQMWSKMSDDEQANALLSAVKDPDKAESLIGSKWESLPSQVTSNMHLFEKLTRVAKHKKLKVSEGALDSKSEKLDKSQAWQMLVKAVDSKPATQQADFIVDLINKFNLDDSVKRRLKMQIKNMA